MKHNGYYRFPTVRNNEIVFVSEDDLWKVPLNGGTAVRITANTAAVSSPKISPDGKFLVYISQEEGMPEVYVKSMSGGEQKRLTFLGARTNVLGWSDDSKYIYFSSSFEQPFDSSIYKISRDGGQEEKIPVGYANQISFGKKGTVIARHAGDPARWKRYRGGTAGEIWIDENGKGEFRQILKDLRSNLACPMLINERIYFVSDHEGIGNIYSCDLKGKNVKRHSHHNEYYARYADTDGKTIVYHSGADLYKIDVAKNKCEMIKVEYVSSHTQTNRKFIDAQAYLEGCDLHPKGTHLAVASRGKLVSFANWTGAVKQAGKKDGIRYRLPSWLHDGKKYAAVSDELDGEDRIIIVDTETGKETLLKNIMTGRVRGIFPSPKTDQLIICNHKNDMILVDYKKNTSKLIDRSDNHRIFGVNWSPDAKWITYSFFNTMQTCLIKVAEVSTACTHEVTKPVKTDSDPVFSSDGKYIFFAGDRIFYPVNDALQFELSFLKSTKLYALPLAKDTRSPFEQDPKSPAGEQPPKDDDKKKKDKDKKEELNVKIDFDGIEKRVVEFPITAGAYSTPSSYKNQLLYVEYPRDGVASDHDNDWGEGGPQLNLKVFNFDDMKEETIISGISDYKLSLTGDTMLVRKGKELSVYKTGAKPDDKAKEKYSLQGGGIDLSRIRIGIIPREEWKQMYREAWLLQREHFWTENMSKIDWAEVFKRYYPLTDRVGSRGEFSDLIWEMQGELGTSHCYEFMGDYRKSVQYPLGKLGCGYKLAPDGKSYMFENIMYGESGERHEISPLLAPGVNVKNGDLLIAVNGTPVNKTVHPRELLVNYPDHEVCLTVKRKGEKENKDVTVKTLGFESKLLYRNWVEKNREYVHKAGKGRIGYIHIPNMGNDGFAEFHRTFLTEYAYDGLIVDVRYNGGGYVSQLLLEKLNRKIIGYDTIRWSKSPESYPSEAVHGPIVALTNEFAGSDGDIFSHSFKLMKIGKLLGKRTWGGVIGINGQYSLVDGTITTQPEYSFWFKDVQWGVENYGTDPDIEIDNTPADYVKGKDNQLEKALEFALDELKKKPVVKPKFDKRPDLSLPKLPK
jgi:tricorn protease